MDFADWCELVLNKIIDASTSPEAVSLGYLTDELLARTLLRSEMPDRFAGSPERQHLHSSIDELVRNALVVKKKVGQMYRIEASGNGRIVSKNPPSLRKEIAKIELSPEAEQLLRLVNSLSQRIEPTMVWAEALNRQYLPQHGWGDKQKRIQAVRELEHKGFVRSYPPQGSDLDLTASYRGVVWQSERDAKGLIEPEIGHVLFTDIVGYSKRPMDTQTELRAVLKQTVRGTEAYNTALADQRIIRRSTGDGMALIFFGNPSAPVRCAVEISRRLRNHPQLGLRMGIHSGPVRRDEDINDELDVAGGGINYAQRVMDAGDAGHILVSNAVAENLEQMGGWSDALHDLGEIIVKHGARIHVFNLSGADFGNSALPASLNRQTDIPA